MKRLWLLLVGAGLLAGCSGHPDIPGLAEAKSSDCVMTVGTDGRLIGSDPVFVGEGQVLAVRIDQYDDSGKIHKSDFVNYAFLDASIEVTNARVGTDADGKPATVGGFPSWSSEPGSFYQQYDSDIGEQVVMEVPTGASYQFYNSRATNGLVGTCEAD